MFKLIYQGKYGDTVESDNPALDAYKQAHYVRNVLDKITEMTFHEDGSITVAGEGLSPITFEHEGRDLYEVQKTQETRRDTESRARWEKWQKTND